MFKLVPSAETAHKGFPAGPGLKVPSVQFHALGLDTRLDHGDDVTPDELEQNAENLAAAARYADALLTLARNGTRDQIIRHLEWFRDRLHAESHNRHEERKQQLVETANH
jgi:hypothetical protein